MKYVYYCTDASCYYMIATGEFRHEVERIHQVTKLGARPPRHDDAWCLMDKLRRGTNAMQAAYMIGGFKAVAALVDEARNA